MTRNCSIKVLSLKFIFILCISLLFNNYGYSQDENEDIEVYLSFRYRGAIDEVIYSYYSQDQFFLPISELFNILSLDQNINLQNLTVTGRYLEEQIPYSIDFENNVIKIGDKTLQISKDDYLVKELDFFLRSDLFKEAFDLEFTVNFNSLTLELRTEKVLPVIARIFREQKRQRANQNSLQKETYPLKYGRNKLFFDAGFLDYNLSALIQQENSYTYRANVGLQLIGGDLQGNLFGTKTSEFSSFQTNSLRWRYQFIDNPLLSSIIIGQTTSNGLIPNAFTGIRLSNQPIEPRVLFDEYIITGTASPESEVELYLNNQIIDFQEVGELGNYRFSAPMTYGTSQYDIRIYGPTGGILERKTRIQIPFSFIPEGEINYNLNVGQLDYPVFGTTKKNMLYQGNVIYGISEWLTAQVGSEFIDTEGTTYPTLSGKLSSRLFSNYILTLEAASEAFFRSSASAVFANSGSFRLDYTSFLNQSGAYNPSGDDQTFIASVFYPITLLGQRLNFRSSTFTRIREEASSSSVRFDLSSRIDRLNLQLGYSDRLVNSINPLDYSPQSLVSLSTTYSFSRSQSIPKIFRGTYISSRLSFLPVSNEISRINANFSKSVGRKGRLQFSYSRNFLTEANSFRLSFAIDLNKARSNTTVISNNNTYSTTQNIRGSIGYDSNYRKLLLSSRDQVGRSATAVRLFVDNNSNGVFDDQDDEINERAVKIDRIGSSLIEKDGILYLTQMRPYFQYNMEVNTAVLPNPLLVPESQKFSLITDPNRFKSIEIPFYMSGVIEGSVQQKVNNREIGVSGLKLLLRNTETNTVKELRTYSDGEYYEYPIKPGNYEIKIAENQLDILQVKSNPEKIDFTVNAIAEGDFIENLSFELIPLGTEEENTEEDSTLVQIPLTLSEVPEELKNSQEIIQLEQQLVTNVEKALRLIILTQNAFFERDFESAFGYINESLQNFETAQGYALKGSIQYFQGDRTGAVASWRMALRFDPDIYIPTLEELDQRVTVSSSE